MTFDPVCDLRNNVADILLPGKLCRQTLTEWVLSQSKRKHEAQFKFILTENHHINFHNWFCSFQFLSTNEISQDILVKWYN